MGVRLMVEVLDHAPATLTPRERWALIAIAEDSRDETRLCLRGVESNPTLARRMRAGRSERAAIIAALIAKGALERVKRGQMHQHAVFRIPSLEPAQDPETPAPEPPASVRETRTLGEAQPPENPDAGDSQGPDSAGPGSGNCPPRVRETRTPSPQSPQDPSSLLSHERVVMEALEDKKASKEETREIISLMKDDARRKNRPIDHLGPFVRAVAKNGDLPDYLNRVRANAERRAAYAERQAQPPPEPEPAGPPVTPEERDAALATARELLRGAQVKRGVGGPARIVRPWTAPETPPEVERAHAELNRRGDALDWMTIARKKLGDGAGRNEVMVLAYELARAGVSSAAAGG